MKTDLLNGKPCGLSIKNPDIPNPAVDRCCDAWTREYDHERAHGRGIVSSGLRANEAFRTAMPPLNSMKNVCDFLSCVAYGIMTGAIGWPAGDRLIKTARVALSLHRATQKRSDTKAKPMSDQSLTNPPGRSLRKNKKSRAETAKLDINHLESGTCSVQERV